MIEYYPAVALVAVIGGFWGWAALQRARLRKAVAEAAARMDGRYEPGGLFSGGTLTVKSGGRDVMFLFALSNSRRPESTAVVVTLSKPVEKELLLKGREAVARVPGLAAHDGLLARVSLHASSNLLTVRVPGVVRRADRLADLASLVSTLAPELERPA